MYDTCKTGEAIRPGLVLFGTQQTITKLGEMQSCVRGERWELEASIKLKDTFLAEKKWRYTWYRFIHVSTVFIFLCCQKWVDKCHHGRLVSAFAWVQPLLGFSLCYSERLTIARAIPSLPYLPKSAQRGWWTRFINFARVVTSRL